jgi:hypothetical protein
LKANGQRLARRSELEELCLATVKHLQGLEEVERVAIVAIKAPQGQPNWLVGHIDRREPLTDEGRRRAEQALEIWRQRFRVLS